MGRGIRENRRNNLKDWVRVGVELFSLFFHFCGLRSGFWMAGNRMSDHKINSVVQKAAFL